MLADAGSTGGAFGLVEIMSEGARVPPMHVHEREDEAFYVLEGELTFFLGDDHMEIGPGGYVFGPRRVPHGYALRSESERHLGLVVPGGWERFFEEAVMSGAAPEDGPPDLQRLADLASRYGVTLLGPVPP